jgi:hypothetical protein
VLRKQMDCEICARRTVLSGPRCDVRDVMLETGGVMNAEVRTEFLSPNDVARPNAPSPPNLWTRRDTSPAVQDKMRFKASIQNINTFTSTMCNSMACEIFSLTECRAYRIPQLTRPARMGEAQRGASMLHHHPRARHPSMGVSTRYILKLDFL